MANTQLPDEQVVALTGEDVEMTGALELIEDPEDTEPVVSAFDDDSDEEEDDVEDEEREENADAHALVPYTQDSVTLPHEPAAERLPVQWVAPEDQGPFRLDSDGHLREHRYFLIEGDFCEVITWIDWDRVSHELQAWQDEYDRPHQLHIWRDDRFDRHREHKYMDENDNRAIDGRWIAAKDGTVHDVSSRIDEDGVRRDVDRWTDIKTDLKGDKRPIKHKLVRMVENGRTVESDTFTLHGNFTGLDKEEHRNRSEDGWSSETWRAGNGKEREGESTERESRVWATPRGHYRRSGGRRDANGNFVPYYASGVWVHEDKLYDIYRGDGQALHPIKKRKNFWCLKNKYYLESQERDANPGEWKNPHRPLDQYRSTLNQVYFPEDFSEKKPANLVTQRNWADQDDDDLTEEELFKLLKEEAEGQFASEETQSDAPSRGRALVKEPFHHARDDTPAPQAERRAITKVDASEESKNWPRNYECNPDFVRQTFPPKNRDEDRHDQNQFVYDDPRQFWNDANRELDSHSEESRTQPKQLRRDPSTQLKTEATLRLRMARAAIKDEINQDPYKTRNIDTLVGDQIETRNLQSAMDIRDKRRARREENQDRLRFEAEVFAEASRREEQIKADADRVIVLANQRVNEANRRVSVEGQAVADQYEDTIEQLEQDVNELKNDVVRTLDSLDAEKKLSEQYKGKAEKLEQMFRNYQTKSDAHLAEQEKQWTEEREENETDKQQMATQLAEALAKNEEIEKRAADERNMAISQADAALARIAQLQQQLASRLAPQSLHIQTNFSATVAAGNATTGRLAAIRTELNAIRGETRQQRQARLRTQHPNAALVQQRQRVREAVAAARQQRLHDIEEMDYLL